jgi:hypothetical protein
VQQESGDWGETWGSLRFSDCGTGGLNLAGQRRGAYVWFNVNFKLSGIPSTGAIVFFKASTVTFMTDRTYTVNGPNARDTASNT